MPPKKNTARRPTRTYLQDVDTEKPPSLYGLKKTALYYGFKDVEELQEFWESKMWKPYAQHILKSVIEPQRATAAALGNQRARAANFATVEAFLEEGESNGRALYSDAFPDFDKFEPLDHYCWAMYNIRYYNTRMFKGLFYGQPNMREHSKLCHVWTMLQVWFYEHTPSRIKRNEEAARKRQAKMAKDSAKHKRTKAENPSGDAETTEGRSSRQSGRDSPSDDDRESTPPDPQQEEAENEDYTEADRVFPDDTHEELDDDVQQALALRIRNSNNADLLTSVVDTDQRDMLSPLHRMHLERKYNDIHDRAYKYDLLMAVRKGFQDPSLIEEQLYRLADQDRSIDDEAWKRHLEKTSGDPDAPQSGDPVLPFDLAADDEKETYIGNRTLLDDAASQPQGHYEACRRMGIDRPDFPRYKSMPVTKSFKFWQVLAFDWIHQVRESHLRGVLLCDSMGLGKTWEVVGYMLSLLEQRRFKKSAGLPLEKALPFLLVLPPGNLPSQWIKEITNITTELTIIKYYGDLNDNLNSSRKKVMTKDDDLFNGAESNASCVIITTYQTFRTRHGPSAQQAWHTKKKNWSHARSTREFHLFDRDWAHGLRGCFNTVIADEAQYIKSTKAQSHIALKWLEAFTILVTATPDINSVYDFEAYINFIQPTSATLQEKVYDVSNIPVDCNPYAAFAKHSVPGRLLRCTTNNLKRFILENSDAVAQGAYLSTLYADCMIRRSNVSIVDGKMIGDEIPALKHRRAMCDWIKDDSTGIDERKDYISRAQPHVRSLVFYDDQGNLMWNWKHYRVLLLLCTWIGFVHVEEIMTAEATGSLIGKGDGLLDWIIQKYCDAVGEAFPTDLPSKLAIICRGSPKMRALLHLIAHVAVLNEKKILIFCSVPAQQTLIFAVLTALKISVGCYYADLNRDEKVKLQMNFNNEDDPQVFIGSFATTSVGLNLQARCHWVIFLDPPPSLATGEQAGGRCHRVGQSEIVEIVTLVTAKSFNDRQVRNNLRKAFPGVVAALNKEAFKGAEIAYNSDGAARLMLGSWVNYNGQLVPVDDPKLPPDHGRPVLNGNQVVIEILEMKMGVRVGWKEHDNDDDDADEDDDQADHQEAENA